MFKLNEIMEMLNIPERTIRRHIKLGLLKGEKIAGTWRFSEDDLNNYFSNAVVQQTQAHVKFKEIFDYLNGISKNENEIVIIKQTNKLTLTKNKELSKYVSNFDDPLYFHLDNKFGKSIITFNGSEKSAISLLHKINLFDNGK